MDFCLYACMQASYISAIMVVMLHPPLCIYALYSPFGMQALLVALITV